MNEQQIKKITESDNLGKVLGSKGSSFPLIQINDYIFSNDEIEYFEIDILGFIPICYLNVHVSSGVFQSQHYPKDGDVITIFHRSENNFFKSLKMDFLIQKYTTNKSDVDVSTTKFYFVGILRIENFLSERNTSFNKKSSLEVILDIADETGLGVVTNETSTNDKMSWLCTWDSYFSFLNDLKTRIYKDEFSFFDIWIDQYYNINFINLNTLFSTLDEKNKPIVGLIKDTMTSDFDNEISKFRKEEIVLTNEESAAQSNNYFIGLKYLSKNGLINSTFGHKQQFFYYDYHKNEVKDFIISSTKTAGIENKKDVMLGRYGEDYYDKDIKGVWSGWSFGGENFHEFYELAKHQNKINKSEIEKLNLSITLPKANFNLYKGMLIPVISISKSPTKTKVAGNFDDYKNNKIDWKVDRSLSAWYVITGIKYVYNKPQTPDDIFNMKQELILSRREWTIPNVPSYTDKNFNV